MKNISLYILSFFLSLPMMAQQQGDTGYDKEKLESAKVAFITQRLDLTPEQAEKFWPLYNQHREDKRNLMKSLHVLGKMDVEGISNEKALELIEQKFDIEQEILDLEKAFHKEIIKVISPVQAVQLGEVNKDFTRHIYHMQKRKKDPEK
jgi:hypothetical protein